VPFPPLKQRFEQLEEALQIARQMWSGTVAPYAGTHYQLAETLNHPQPLTRPHPPILIGGAGEKKTLRLVAQYADACNLFAFAGPQAIRQKLDVLKRHCDEVGRPYDDIERTALGVVNLAPGEMTPANLIATCRALADVGIKHFVYSSVGAAHRGMGQEHFATKYAIEQYIHALVLPLLRVDNSVLCALTA